MPIVEATAIIATTPEAAFAVSQDYYERMKWDPFLSEIKFLGGATTATLGGRVWVKAKNGFAMTVEYRVVRPPTHVAVTMVEGPFFFEEFGGTWHFEPAGDQQTQATFRYSFRTRWPLLRPLMDRIIRLVFARDIRARVGGLKKFMEGKT